MEANVIKVSAFVFHDSASGIHMAKAGVMIETSHDIGEQEVLSIDSHITTGLGFRIIEEKTLLIGDTSGRANVDEVVCLGVFDVARGLNLMVLHRFAILGVVGDLWLVMVRGRGPRFK